MERLDVWGYLVSEKVTQRFFTNSSTAAFAIVPTQSQGLVYVTIPM